MQRAHQKIAFVLASADHGTMIVNRMDYHSVDANVTYGVGFEILETGGFERSEIESIATLLDLRRKHFGDGVMAIDCGANIGTHTIEWAKLMNGWGSMLALEAQERVFYALAGNIAINNCFNARAIYAAVGESNGELRVPMPNYMMAGSFGSLELKLKSGTEFIGQPIDYSPEKTIAVPMIALDSLHLPRVDLIKIDVEGMELDVLRGAAEMLQKHKPILLIEAIKVSQTALQDILASHQYRTYRAGKNFLAIHPSDPASAAIAVR